MSDDRKPTGADGDAAPPGAAHDLLTAYVDGVAELPADERRAVEGWLAGDAAARDEAAALRGVLGELRALPAIDEAAGSEPDWAAMERSIRQAVADVPIRPWWRRWQWLVPAMTCATAAAVLVVVWPRAQTVPVAMPERAPITAPPATPATPSPGAASAATGDEAFALWLDGRIVEVDPAVAPSAVDDVLGDVDAPTAGDAFDDALLPATDLAWLQSLDEDELARAERWLAEPDAAGGDASEPGGEHRGHGPYRKKT